MCLIIISTIIPAFNTVFNPTMRLFFFLNYRYTTRTKGPLKRSAEGFIRIVFDDVYAIFYIKANVVGTHLNFLWTIYMTTRNICSYKEEDRSTRTVI